MKELANNGTGGAPKVGGQLPGAGRGTMQKIYNKAKRQREVSPRLIFVVGASRSGTTMLNRMLGRHPDITGSNELHYFGSRCAISGMSEGLRASQAENAGAILVARLDRGIWGGPPTVEDQGKARELLRIDAGREYSCASVYEAILGAYAAGTKYITDQTPRNLFYSDELLRQYPGARVVQVIRDPRAVMASQKFRHRRRSLGGSNMPRLEMWRVAVNYHPFTMAKLWVSAAEKGARMKGHPRFMQVRFEDLLSSTTETLQKVTAFLDLPYDTEMPKVPQVGSSSRMNRSGVVGVDREMMNAWRMSLPAADVAIAERVAGAWMAEFGYEPSGLRSSVLGLGIKAGTYPLHLLGALLVNPKRLVVQAQALLRGRGEGKQRVT